MQIAREKEKHREEMRRQILSEHPEIDRLELKKYWRKNHLERELEKWTEDLIHQQYLLPENYDIVQHLRDAVLPEEQMIVTNVTRQIQKLLQNGKLFILTGKETRKARELTREGFIRLQREAPTMPYGGLGKICVQNRRNKKIQSLFSMFQKYIDRSLLEQFYARNPNLSSSQTYMDEGGRSRVVGVEVQYLIKDSNCTFRIQQRLKKQFQFIYNLSIMMENPRYAFLKDIYQEELRKDELVLTAIPDNLIDAYPYARNRKRHFILHVGGTNTGKTYEALEDMKKAASAIYLAPLRLLAFEVSDKLNTEGVPCSMRTGEEESIVAGAAHEACTVEKLLLRNIYDVGVIDEAQMIADTTRGWAWTQAILGLCAGRIHICMSQDAMQIVISLIQLCHDDYEIVKHERNTELVVEEKPFSYPADIQEHDACVVFSREKVIRVATDLERHGIRTSMIYGSLPSNVRKGEMLRFLSGETQVVVATDAIGMGLNLPIRRIVFLENQKFDGEKKRYLRSTEIKQIAGRAGRRGIYETGYVACVGDKRWIEECRKKLNGPLRPIKKAKIGFPQSMLTLDMNLSDIFNRWMKIPDQGNVEKTNMEKEAKLCAYMEGRYHFDKETMMGFATIPFDLQRTAVFEYWKYLIHCYATEDGNIDIPEPQSVNSLEDMETLYKQYDLLYSFSKVIRNEYLMKLVLEDKDILSERIRKTVAEKDANEMISR